MDQIVPSIWAYCQFLSAARKPNLAEGQESTSSLFRTDYLAGTTCTFQTSTQRLESR